MHLLTKTFHNVKSQLKPKVKENKTDFLGDRKNNFTFPLDLFEEDYNQIARCYEKAEQFSKEIQPKVEKLFKLEKVNVKLSNIHIVGSILLYQYKIKQQDDKLDTKTLEYNLSDMLGLQSVFVFIQNEIMNVQVPLKQYAGIETDYDYSVPISNKSMFGNEELENPNEFIVGLSNENKVFKCNIDNYRNMLVTGISGCGKSNWFHQIFLSMMSRNTPDEFKIAIIDFSRFEYEQYNGLPYMLTNVIGDIDKTKSLIEYLNSEIEQRQQTFFDNNIESINEYNQKAYENNQTKLERWTILVDEIRYLKEDKDVFELLGEMLNKTQLLRNLGIHFIVGSQIIRDSILTRKLKEDCDLKIIMQASSKVESQNIIGREGAESLLSGGDMLVKKGEQLERLQSSYISDSARMAIFEFLKNKYNKPKLLAL